jgi:hypothetical protein
MPLVPGTNYQFPTVNNPPATVPGLQEIGGQPQFYNNVVPGGSVSIGAGATVLASALGIAAQGFYVLLLPASVSIQYTIDYGTTWVNIIPAQSAATWFTLVLDPTNFRFNNTGTSAVSVTTVLAILR